MLFISFAGNPLFLLFVTPVVLWCWDRSLGVRLMTLFSLSFGINTVLQLFFHSPRPYWVGDDVKAFAPESSFGMPSCHAQASATFFGYIAVWMRKRAVWAACIAMIVVVGISRLYLGVHFLGDILTGWIAAIIILATALQYGDAAAAWFFRQKVAARILVALAVSAIIVAASQLVIMDLGAWQVPAAWSGLALAKTHVAINPLSPGDTLLATGVLFGAVAGAGISAEYIPYSAGGSRAQKAIRAALGILVLVLILVALDAATKLPGIAGYGMSYCRSALMGAWITAGAPFVFCRLGLMGQK
jgi:hypothetical protein